MSETSLFQDKYQIAFLMDFYGALLSERTQEIMLLSLDEDMSLGEIATLKKISRQAVHDSIKRGEENLIRYESVLHLARKALAGRELIGELRDLLPQDVEDERIEPLLEQLYGLLLS